MNNIRVFYSNLSKAQKITLWFFTQLIVAAILFSIVGIAMQKQEHVFVENYNELSHIPEKMRDTFRGALWGVIQNSATDVKDDIINDVVIRDGTYKETDNELGGKVVEFIVDIDSLKQTYAVSMAWGKENYEFVQDIVVNCPPQSLMKYPDTVCYGMTNNTYSLDLYLPHSIMAPHNNDVFDVKIRGDEYERKIYVSVADCNPNKLKQQAMEYLQSTPIKLSEYEIIYDVVNLEYPYFNDDMSETEINNLKEKCKNG